jgi:SAM-dependent methyltransferase
MLRLYRRVAQYLRSRHPRAYAAARRGFHVLLHRIQALEQALAHLVFERGLHDTGWRRPVLGLAPGYKGYEASRYSYLWRALRGERIGPDDVFVDLGCGQGRIVLQAARRPFRRVVGVEISRELMATARHNLQVQRDEVACRDVELLTMDVLDYEIPPDATYLYLFNTVVGEPFRRLVGNIAASYDRRPRRMRVLYVNPTQADVLDRSERFARRRVARGLRHDRDIAVYDVLPRRS